MYDTVNFWIDNFDVSNGNPFEVVPYLTEITELHNEKKGYSYTGYMGDYTAKVYKHGIYLYGSLAKYFLNNNIGTLTRSATQQAIEKMSEQLHTDICKAKIMRIDVSTVIPTKQPPQSYYHYLGQKPYFKRLQTHIETLQYNNHLKQLIFYDKVEEAKNKNVTIPPLLENDNLLRYEMRILKRINYQYKTEVTSATLYDEKFYYNIIQQWYNEFKTIQKLKSNNFMIENINSKKAAKEAFLSFATQFLLQEKGHGIIDEFLQELKSEKKLPNRSDYSKLRTELNKINVSKNGNKNDLINELETAIFEVAKYGR